MQVKPLPPVPTAADTVVASLDHDVQAELVQQVRHVLEHAPLVRPTTPNGMAMRVRVSAAGRLGWVGDGAYRYSPTQRDGRPWPPIPTTWLAIADQVAGVHGWDSAIINWYDEDAALGWHRDLAEADHALPIVTISLGDAASWAIRLDEESPVTRTRLESGDITLLAGRARMALHTIERVIPAPLLSPLGTTRGRISITLRVAGGDR